MKLNDSQKVALGKLLAHLRKNDRLTFVKAATPRQQHVILSRLGRNLGPVLVITENGNLPKLHELYERSLGLKEKNTLYAIENLHSLRKSRLQPSVIVIDVRREMLDRALECTRRWPQARVVTCTYGDASLPKGSFVELP